MKKIDFLKLRKKMPSHMSLGYYLKVNGYKIVKNAVIREKDEEKEVREHLCRNINEQE